MKTMEYRGWDVEDNIYLYEQNYEKVRKDILKSYYDLKSNDCKISEIMSFDDLIGIIFYCDYLKSENEYLQEEIDIMEED